MTIASSVTVVALCICNRKLWIHPTLRVDMSGQNLRMYQWLLVWGLRRNVETSHSPQDSSLVGNGIVPWILLFASRDTKLSFTPSSLRTLTMPSLHK